MLIIPDEQKFDKEIALADFSQINDVSINSLSSINHLAIYSSKTENKSALSKFLPKIFCCCNYKADSFEDCQIDYCSKNRLIGSKPNTKTDASSSYIEILSWSRTGFHKCNKDLIAINQIGNCGVGPGINPNFIPLDSREIFFNQIWRPMLTEKFRQTTLSKLTKDEEQKAKKDSNYVRQSHQQIMNTVNIKCDLYHPEFKNFSGNLDFEKHFLEYSSFFFKKNHKEIDFDFKKEIDVSKGPVGEEFLTNYLRNKLLKISQNNCGVSQIFRGIAKDQNLSDVQKSLSLNSGIQGVNSPHSIATVKLFPHDAIRSSTTRSIQKKKTLKVLNPETNREENQVITEIKTFEKFRWEIKITVEIHIISNKKSYFLQLASVDGNDQLSNNHDQKSWRQIIKDFKNSSKNLECCKLDWAILDGDYHENNNILGSISLQSFVEPYVGIKFPDGASVDERIAFLLSGVALRRMILGRFDDVD